jgi:hypothetical protein
MESSERRPSIQSEKPKPTLGEATKAFFNLWGNKIEQTLYHPIVGIGAVAVGTYAFKYDDYKTAAAAGIGLAAWGLLQHFREQGYKDKKERRAEYKSTIRKFINERLK